MTGIVIASRTPAVLLRMTDMDTSDFRCYASLLDHSIGADHGSRAFQFTPTLALSFFFFFFFFLVDWGN